MNLKRLNIINVFLVCFTLNPVSAEPVFVTGIWSQLDGDHYFMNIDDGPTWFEVFNDEFIDKHQRFDENDVTDNFVTLNNGRENNSFIILADRDLLYTFSNNIAYRKSIGSWLVLPYFIQQNLLSEGIKQLVATRYTVESGDTLSKIIKKICGNDRLLNEIAKSNKIEDPDFIFVGQNLLIDCPKVQAPLTSMKNSTEGVIKYNVVSGDTLSLILRRLCGNDRQINEIVKLNNLENPNFIYVGQTLDIICSNSFKTTDSVKKTVEFKYLKWEDEDDKTHYFEKKTSKLWIELSQNVFSELFTEHKQFNDDDGQLVVILKRKNDEFVKLTNIESYQSDDENSFNRINSGKWSLQKDKYGGNFAYQRWAVKNDDTTYFERQSNSTWIEFRNEEFHTTLAEMSQNYESNGGLVVILKNDDGKFVKLTNESSYSGENEDNITDFISNGTWTDDGKQNFEKIISKISNLTAVWKEKSDNNIHFFVNIDNKIVWNEYRDDTIIQNHTLFKYIGFDLILKNQIINDSYIILTKTDYSIGSLASLSNLKRNKIPGSWHKEPLFTDLIEIEKKIRWVYKDNTKRFYKKNPNKNTWDEITNNQITNSFQIQTFVSNKILLKHEIDETYVELSENKVRILFGSLENLDENSEEHFGNWIILLGNEKCGVPSAEPDLNFRIKGGKEAIRNSFPWMALVIIRTKNGGLGECGGTLISHSWILTAAHCWQSDQQFLEVYLGIHNKTQDLNENTKITVPNSSFFRHQNFNPDKKLNDIALIRLPKPVTFTEEIKPICLPNKNYAKVSTNTIITGWGTTTTENSNSSDVLKQVEIPILSLSDCEIINNSTKLQSAVHICAGTKSSENSKDACKGDSGGPQIIRNPEKVYQFIQIGIVSFGVSDACAGKGVYTNLFNFMGWIRKTINNINNKDTLFFI